MKNQYVLILAGATAIMLGGCGSSSSSPVSSADPSLVSKLFSGDPNGNPETISDAVALSTDIDSIFGGENDEPVSVKPGDTIGDVLDRAKSS